MADLSGKVAVITGAASGIGLAGVETFVEAGAKVIAADIQDEKGRALETRFGTDTVRYIHCDVMDLAELEALMEGAVSHFGKIDAVWNNAGSGGTPASIEELDEEGYDKTMDLLLKQVFFGTKYAVSHMKESGGSIINTSSISALEAGYLWSAAQNPSARYPPAVSLCRSPFAWRFPQTADSSQTALPHPKHCA